MAWDEWTESRQPQVGGWFLSCLKLSHAAHPDCTSATLLRSGCHIGERVAAEDLPGLPQTALCRPPGGGRAPP